MDYEQAKFILNKYKEAKAYLDTHRTFDEWNTAGYRIIKGSKALEFYEGNAIFNKNQVEDCFVYPYDSNEFISSSNSNDEWYVNNGYVKFGGMWIDPRDPLSDFADSYNQKERGFGW